MEGMAFFAALALYGLLAGVLPPMLHRIRRGRRALHLVARRLRMSRQAVDGWLTLRLRGEYGGFPILIRSSHLRTTGQGPLVRIDASGRIPASLRIELEVPGSIGRLFRGPDVATGAPDFDRLVLVLGDPLRLAAVLDAPTREFIVQGVRHQLLSVREGVIEAAASWGACDDNKLIGEANRLLWLARQLTPPEDLAERLAHNAQSDPVPGVRLHCLHLLSTHFQEDERTQRTLGLCLADRDAQVRAFAARSLGPEGVSTLREILRRKSSPEDVAVNAVETLGRDLPLKDALRALEQSLAAQRRGLATALLAWLGQHGGSSAVPRLSEMLGSDDHQLVAAAASGLGVSGDGSAEPSLLRALSHSSAEVRRAAAGALGRVGGVAAVMPLRATVADNRLDLILRRAALAAIAAIQARLTGAVPGQLALAEAHRGPAQPWPGLGLRRDGIADG